LAQKLFEHLSPKTKDKNRNITWIASGLPTGEICREKRRNKPIFDKSCFSVLSCPGLLNSPFTALQSRNFSISSLSLAPRVDRGLKKQWYGVCMSRRIMSAANMRQMSFF